MRIEVKKKNTRKQQYVHNIVQLEPVISPSFYFSCARPPNHFLFTDFINKIHTLSCEYFK